MKGSVGATAAVGVEVLLFFIGTSPYVVARGEVQAIRVSPRAGRNAAERAGAAALVSLSALLGLERDTSTDRRVIEVAHAGRAVSLEVTSIAGIRRLFSEQLSTLPALVLRNCASSAVLGLAETEVGWAIALDAARLLAERLPPPPPAS